VHRVDQLRRDRQEPLWLQANQYTQSQLKSNIRYWLLDEGSLTSRLIQASNNHFKVHCLKQSWQIPLASEQRLLNIKTRQLAVIREVLLMCEDQPWVFARSIMPVTTLTGSLRCLHYLQNKSLGALLFNTPSMKRAPFQLARIAGDSHYLPTEIHQSQNLWGRRSRFLLYDKPLIVSEVFLPAFTPWQKNHSTRELKP